MQARTYSSRGCDFLKIKKTCKTNQITEYECLMSITFRMRGEDITQKCNLSRLKGG